MIKGDRVTTNNSKASIQLEMDSLDQSRTMRAEFRHEREMLTDQHFNVMRVGYLGGRRDSFVKRMDKIFGNGDWTIAYVMGGKALDRDSALTLYQKSYEQFLLANPEFTKELLNKAKDVYDTNVSNVQSGLDWYKQEDDRSHLQDIAVRRALSVLGMKFSGSELLQIRGHDSDLPELNPGRVPFIYPDYILKDRIFSADWIAPSSVEDFWQNNKFIFVNKTESLSEKLTAEVVSSIRAGKEQGHKLVSEKMAALIAFGDADAKLVSDFSDYLHSLYNPDKGIDLSDFHDTWTQEAISNLSHLIPAMGLSEEQIVDRCSSLLPVIKNSADHRVAITLSTEVSSDLNIGIFCALIRNVGDLNNELTSALWLLLNIPEVISGIEDNPRFRDTIKYSPIVKDAPGSVSKLLDRMYNLDDDIKSRFLNAISSLR